MADQSKSGTAKGSRAERDAAKPSLKRLTKNRSKAKMAGRRIKRELLERLKDHEFRQEFFVAESSVLIATQLIALRRRRNLTQRDVAELIGSRQPSISRFENAHYQRWSFSFLRKIASALDARIRVVIEPSEEVLNDYIRKNPRGKSS